MTDRAKREDLEARLDLLVDRLRTIEKSHALLRSDPATLVGPWVLLPFFESVLSGRERTPELEASARGLRRDGFLYFGGDVDGAPAFADTDERRRRAGRLLDECEMSDGIAWSGVAPAETGLLPPRSVPVLEWLFGPPARVIGVGLARRSPDLATGELHHRSLPDRLTALALRALPGGPKEIEVWPRHDALPRFGMEELASWAPSRPEDAPDRIDRWRRLTRAALEALGIEPVRVVLQPGECVVLSGDAVHRVVPGAAEGDDDGVLRVAIQFGDSIPYAPLRSDPVLGRYALDPCGWDPPDGDLPYGWYRCERHPDGGAVRLALSHRPTEREAAYLLRHPDVGASRFAAMPAGARLHFELYGRREGREF